MHWSHAGASLSVIDIVTAPFDAFNWLTDEMFLLLRDLFERFGVPIVFLAALSEATVGVGLVVPGVLLIFVAGVYAQDTDTSLTWMLAVATIGTILGDTVSYGLGRWGGRRLEGTRFARALRMGEVLVSGQARWFIPLYHFNSVTRTVGPFGAGALRMPLRAWLPLDYLGALLANAVWMGAGAIFGRALLNEDGTLNEHPALRLGIVAAVLLWVVVIQRELKKQRARRQADLEAQGERLRATTVGGAPTGPADGDAEP
ncbi:MAG: VTT domain-containing protein [Dehalococcoidia bacterium]|nr:VTT domain-containing protein [Dehalococcoidia bacterium]